MELPHEELLLSGLVDVLHQPCVVDVGAVKADAIGLLDFDRPHAERLHYLPGPLTPVASGDGRDRQGERHAVERESQGCSLSPLYTHSAPGGTRRQAIQASKSLLQTFKSFCNWYLQDYSVLQICC